MSKKLKMILRKLLKKNNFHILIISFITCIITIWTFFDMKGYRDFQDRAALCNLKLDELETMLLARNGNVSHDEEKCVDFIISTNFDFFKSYFLLENYLDIKKRILLEKHLEITNRIIDISPLARNILKLNIKDYLTSNEKYLKTALMNIESEANTGFKNGNCVEAYASALKIFMKYSFQDRLKYRMYSNFGYTELLTKDALQKDKKRLESIFNEKVAILSCALDENEKKVHEMFKSIEKRELLRQNRYREIFVSILKLKGIASADLYEENFSCENLRTNGYIYLTDPKGCNLNEDEVKKLLGL